MERRIEEYLKIDEKIPCPYDNHYGHGDSMGYCDEKNRGRAFIFYNTNNNYSGKDIISFNGNKIYDINGYLLYITNVHGPWANAEIIKNDFTTQSCYVGRINNLFAVSYSIRNTLDELRELISHTNDNEKDIAKAFVIAHPLYEEEYDWDEMVLWHSMTYRSCSEGRKKFSFRSNKPNGSKGTPKELIKLMKEYGVTRLANEIEKCYIECSQ